YSYQVQFRHVIVFAVMMVQLSFYCVPANYVADEALTIAEAAYFSKWYLSSFPSLKAPLLLMIENSQKEIIIKAGGIITINADTVVKVVIGILYI
ncbi:hypothetical protein ILUMI_20014, partial [Ignelater luminosus]